LEKHVTADTKPSFVCLAADDDVVPPAPHGIAFYSQLQDKKVASQLNMFEKGGHGFSLHWAQGKPCGAWPQLFLALAAAHGCGVYREHQAEPGESAPDLGSAANGPGRGIRSACRGACASPPPWP